MKIPKVKERVFIRLLKAEDIDRAAALEKENLGNEAWTLEQLLTASTRDDTIYLVAEKQGQIIGLCGVQNIQGDGEITNVSVDKNMRGEGVGYKMMRQLLERGRGIGIVNYTMEVRSSNVAARKLYEKLGFKSDGKRPGFYDNPKDDAEIYWLRNTQSE
jgi:ribosomal-protein-alanine acetyltransferase